MAQKTNPIQSQLKPNSKPISCPERFKNRSSISNVIAQISFFCLLHPVLYILFEKSLSVLSASQPFAKDMLMRKPRSMRIKKLTTNRMVANLRSEELNSGFVVSKLAL